MKRSSGKTEDTRLLECPQCNKRRMTRPLKHTVSLERREYKTRTGESVTLFTDICGYCKTRNYRDYFEHTQADVKRIMQAIKEEKQLDGQSLEDLL